MLVLSRKQDDAIIIGDSIKLMVVSIQGDKVRLGIEAPREIDIHREEVYEAIQRDRDNEPASCIGNIRENVESIVNQTVGNIVATKMHGCESGPGRDH